MDDVRTDEHMDRDKYARYHQAVWLPSYVQAAAHEFLPPPRTVLPLSNHYQRIMKERKLPFKIYMPRRYQLVEATVVRETQVIFRVLIRFSWGKNSDFCAALEGDGEIVTGFWNSPTDNHFSLNAMGIYEQDEAEYLRALEAQRRESRPDNIT